MKVRSDFVSNSSSASFVVEGKDSAIKFYEDFKELIDKGSFPTEPSISIEIKPIGDSDWGDCIELNEFTDKVKDGELSWDDVKSIYFDSSDEDEDGIGYLGFLYMYFIKMGFQPNDKDSQRNFLGSQANMEFLNNLLDKIGSTNENTK